MLLLPPPYSKIPEHEPKLEYNPMRLDTRRRYARIYKKRAVDIPCDGADTMEEDTKRVTKKIRVPTHLSHEKSADCGVWGRSSGISTGLVLIRRRACSCVNRNM